MKKTNKSAKRVECRLCGKGKCCREGVEVDLFEVARILKTKLDIPKPWFRYLGRDKSFPSGHKFSTVIRNRRCVFQNDQMRCAVYNIRPTYCAEFPMEDGKIAEFFRVLCHFGKEHER